ncbi:hypothetical protein ACFE04_011316 [Oxalis oulophora]
MEHELNMLKSSTGYYPLKLDDLQDDLLMCNRMINGGMMDWIGTPDYNGSKNNKFQLKVCRLFAFVAEKQMLIVMGKKIADGAIANDVETQYPLRFDKYKVQVDLEIIGDAIIPCPTLNFLTVSQSVTNHVTWPKSLIDFENNTKQPIRYTRTKNKCNRRALKVETYNEILKLWAFEQHELAAHLVRVSPEVFGHEVEFHMTVENFRQFSTFRDIDVVCIAAYMQYKYNEILLKFNLTGIYGFAYPVLLAHTNGNGNMRVWAERLSGYLLNGYQVGKITFVSWLHENHWMLMIVDPYANTMQWFDSLGGNIREEAMIMVKWALRMFHEKRGTYWNEIGFDAKVVTISLQPTTHECGYCVMRFISLVLSRRMRVVESPLEVEQYYTKVVLEKQREERGKDIEEKIDDDDTTYNVTDSDYESEELTLPRDDLENEEESDPISKTTMQFKKNDSKRVRAKCAEGCKWEILISNVGRNIYCHVKTLITGHNCSRSLTNHNASRKWLVRHMTPVLMRDYSMGTAKVVEHVKHHMYVEITKNMAWRVCVSCFDAIHGDYKQQYARIRDYGVEIKRSNLGASVIYGTNSKDQWSDVGGLDVTPPLVKKKPGRKRKLRLKKPEESKDKSKKSRVGTPKSCKKCGRTGHNMRTCKGIPFDELIYEQNLEGPQTTIQAPGEDPTELPSSLHFLASVDSDLPLSGNIRKIQVLTASMTVPPPVANSRNNTTDGGGPRRLKVGRGRLNLVVSTQ